MTAQTFELPASVNDVCDRVKKRLQQPDEGLDNRCNIVATKLYQVFHAYNYETEIVRGVIAPPRVTYSCIEDAIKDNAHLHWWVHVTENSTTYLIDLYNNAEEIPVTDVRCEAPTDTHQELITNPEGSLEWYGVSNPVEWVNETRS